MIDSKRQWTTHDTVMLKRIGSVDPSPDGKSALFTLTQAVLAPGQSQFLAQIYLAAADSDAARPLTSGEHSSFDPQWSPDGHTVAYISQGNIWLLSLETGAVHQLTKVLTGVSSFKWSPDGSRIAFTALDETVSNGISEKNGPRIVRQILSTQRLFLASVADTASGPVPGQPLTAPNIHVGSPEVPGAYQWSPDGKTIVFSHSRSSSQDDWPTTRLARLSLEDGVIQPLGPPDRVAWDPQISPDGQWIACKIYDHPVWEWASQVHLLPISGGQARPLAGTADRRPDIFGWSADGGSIYYLETHGTRDRLCALPVDGGVSRVLFASDGCIDYARLNHARRAVGLALQTLTQPPEAFLMQLDDFTPRPVSQVNRDAQQIPMGRTEVLHWKSIDGLEIEGLLTYPLIYEKGKRYPLLVSVHGGPANAWRQFFTGMQSFYGQVATFSARGYAILRCNVRGSTGYGQAFRRANYRDWGGKDFQDLLSGVDHVIALGIADPQRLCIIGWSYGGYLTAATITQTDRFRAAVIGSGMVDLVSYATGHDSPGFVTSYFGGEVWEVADLLLERSPIAHTDHITTPTLILHGELDQRVPIWQGYEFYNALTRSGCPTQMVVYPRTGHVPSEPNLLLDVMDRTLAWMETHLSDR